MNIQTEQLDNHRARLTVEIEPKRWEDAKLKAARQLSKRVNIPGFRKGKAPYRILVNYIGEAPIIEQAMEDLGNKVYKDALDQSEVKPYTSGSLEDFQLEPQPTYVFSVPLEPEVELGDYREVRLDYTAPEVTDDEFERAMRQLQQQEAETEELEEGPVAEGHRVTVDIHSEFADGEERPEIDEADDEEDEEDENVAYLGDQFFHRHDAAINLDPENEPVLPGFVAAMVGAELDGTHEFELTIPEDDEDYEGIQGRKVKFSVHVKKIESVNLPEMNDEFAAKVTEDEDEPLNLEQLRDRIRENLEQEKVRRSEDEYANQVLDEIVTISSVKYPEEMVEDRIEDMLKEFEGQLSRQNIDLETYFQITGTQKSDLQAQYRPDAEKSLTRSLVLGEIVQNEDVKVPAAKVDAQIDDMLKQFGEQAEMFRQFLDTPQQRQNIINNLLYEAVMKRLVKIGRGESLDDEDEDEVVAAEAEAPVVADEEPVTESDDTAADTSDVSPEATVTEDSDDDNQSDESAEEDTDDTEK